MAISSRSPKVSFVCSTIGATTRHNSETQHLDIKPGWLNLILFNLFIANSIFILFITRISPLYEIIVNKDDSYERIANLLIDLKTALKDINELRNEPILLKIQSLCASSFY